MKHPYQAVIARYKEDISWTYPFEKYVDIIIYDKANPLAENYLPNIPFFDCPSFRGSYHAKTPTGRESHTYLYHILKHYPNFADFTLFSQARVDDHLPNFHATFAYLVQNKVKVDFLHFGNLEMSDQTGRNLHRGLPLKAIFCRLFDACFNQFLLYHLSACFIVSRDRILMRPKAFYEEMMQIIYEEPLSGYVFERFWEFVFNAPDLKTHSQYPLPNYLSWQLEGLCPR